MNPVTTIEAPVAKDREVRHGPRNLAAMVFDSAERHSGIALQSMTTAISYPEMGGVVSEIARGLISLGIDRGDRVAILASTSAEWVLADYGTLCAAAVVTPIYHTNSPHECAYVLEHSGARIVFCEDAAQAAKIEQIRDRCPDLEQVVLFSGEAEGALTLAQLRERAADITVRSVHLRVESIEPGDVATLVYTSGTTGPPKACMLSHENLLETAHTYIEQLGINDTHTLYQFLPLAHVLARVAQATVLMAGARSVFWSGDASRIVDELSELAPTHFPAVPRIYEKIHGSVIGKLRDASRVQRALFAWAMACGARARRARREGRKLGLVDDAQFRIADQLVLSRIRSVFGPSLQLAMVGAAPVAKELLEFFDACGVLVVEGYGLSESTAASTLNTPHAVRFGTVGRPLPGTEVEIAADGEILIRGPHVFKGYYKDDAATAEVMTDDGWLHSGDLGTKAPDGFVSITGRKKDLIITSNGKNVTPVNIESALRDRCLITEAVVFGDNRPYLVAMMTLDRDEAAKLAHRLGIDPNPATIAQDLDVRAEIQKQVDTVNQKLARIEQIKRFAILDHDLSQAEGELTPTLKVKRAFVYRKYADVFAGLYENGGGES
jgi:long-chain acyl-CoA synthetase